MPETTPTPPAVGDNDKAVKYLQWLIDLLEQDKLQVYHTDLQKYDPSSIQDHYQLSLSDYAVEVSHARYPNTDKDTFVMLFNNIANLSEGAQKVILAYIPLTENQFTKFKDVADNQIDRRKKLEEELRFKEVMAPVDKMLENLSSTTNSIEGESKDHSDYPTPTSA